MTAKSPEDMADELLADVCGDTCARAQTAVLEAFRAYGRLVQETAAKRFDQFAEKAASEAKHYYSPRVDDLDEVDDDSEQEWLDALDRKSVAEGHAKAIREMPLP